MIKRIFAPAMGLVLGAALACGTPASAQDIIIDRDAAGRLIERLRNPDLGVVPPVDFDAPLRPIAGSVFVYGTSFRKSPGDEFERGELVLGILFGNPILKGFQMARLPYETVSQTPPPDRVIRDTEGSVLDIVQTADGDLFAAHVYLTVFDQVPGRNFVTGLEYLLIGDARARRLHQIEAELARPSGDFFTDWINPGNWEHVAQRSAISTRCVLPLVRAGIEAGFPDGGGSANYTLGDLDTSVYISQLTGFTEDDRLVVKYEISYTAAFTLAVWPGSELEVTGREEIVVDYVRGGDDIWRIGECAVDLADVARLPVIAPTERLSVSDDGVIIVDRRILTNRANVRMEPGLVSAVAGPRP